MRGIAAVHESSIEGDTAAPAADASTGNHFITFARVRSPSGEWSVVELDGGKTDVGAINHGALHFDTEREEDPEDPEDIAQVDTKFLDAVSAIIQREFLSKDPDALFNIMVLAKKQTGDDE